MPHKPLVAISGSIDKDEGRCFLYASYFQALHEVGLVPVLLSPFMGEDDMADLLRHADGLMFAGGDDLNPTLYGEPHDYHIGQLEPLRDQCECALIRMAYQLQTPVLGICRGIQSINVALGGTLYQDLPTQYHGTAEMPSYLHFQTLLGKYPSHTVRAVENTPLADILPAGDVRVNSFHHQAVKAVAEPLKPCAYASDGLTEAVYAPGLPFFIGVQWHPERMYPTDAAARSVFEAYADACRARMNGRCGA